MPVTVLSRQVSLTNFTVERSCWSSTLGSSACLSLAGGNAPRVRRDGPGVKLVEIVVVALAVCVLGSLTSDHYATPEPRPGDVIVGAVEWPVPSIPTVAPLNEPTEGCWRERGIKVCGLWGLRPVTA